MLKVKNNHWLREYTEKKSPDILKLLPFAQSSLDLFKQQKTGTGCFALATKNFEFLSKICMPGRAQNY